MFSSNFVTIEHLYMVMILNFRTDKSGNHCRLSKEQSDQGLCCLPFGLHLLSKLFGSGHAKTCLMPYANN